VGGLGFIAVQTCQTVGRLLGDPAVTRFGDRAWRAPAPGWRCRDGVRPASA
jgi:hypothetical protein